MIQFDKPFFAIDYNHTLRCAVHVCKGYFLREEYQEAMNQCVEVIHQTGATSLIVNVEAIRSEESWDLNWTSTEWFPRILDTDVRKMAVIVPQRALAQLPSRPIQLSVADQLLVGRFFDNVEDAIQWIRFFA